MNQNDDASAAQDHFGLHIPYMQTIGLEPVSIGEGAAATRLRHDPSICNSRGDVHGGALMSALDFTLSAAARSHDLENLGMATVDMSTHFLAPARGDLRVEARVLRTGRSLIVSEGAVLDADGVKVCVATATFRALQRNGR